WHGIVWVGFFLFWVWEFGGCKAVGHFFLNGLFLGLFFFFVSGLNKLGLNLLLFFLLVIAHIPGIKLA
ncbi:UNVERIFIED_CONTAM: hypothetical protein NY100_34095, partial [Prevotella sp. 15_C9]